MLPTLADLQASHAATAGQRYVGNLMLKASPLLQLLPLDNSTNPVPGKPMVYQYGFQKDMKVAQTRDYNTDFNTGHVTTDDRSVQLRLLGDAFAIDRALINADSVEADVAGMESYIELNTREVVDSTMRLVNDLAIAGDNATNATEPDGLSKMLEGTTSELGAINLALGQTDAQYLAGLEPLKKAINRVRAFGLEPVIFGNEDSILRLETIATALKYLQSRRTSFGADINTYAGAPLIDLGDVGSTDGTGGPIIPTASNLTDLYVVGMGDKGFHGVTLSGSNYMRTYSSLYTNTPGVERKFEAELAIAYVLKSSRSATVFRDCALA